MEALQDVHTFSVALCKEVLWSNIHFYFSLPHAVALALLPDSDSRNEGSEHLRLLTETVLEAEQVCRVGHDCGELQECLEELGWRKEMLPRFIMRHLIGTDFSLEDEELRRLAVRMFAGTASSKDSLESCFGWVQRQLNFANTNQRASEDMKYLLASLNPYANAAGASKIIPKNSDWWQAWHAPSGKKTIQENAPKFYNVNSTPMPALPDEKRAGQQKPFPTPQALGGVKWQPAGAAATQRGAAALAFLMHDKDDGWSSLGQCWTGTRQGGVNDGVCLTEQQHSVLVPVARLFVSRWRDLPEHNLRRILHGAGLPQILLSRIASEPSRGWGEGGVRRFVGIQ